jgi:hypothetical protein
MNDVYSVPRCSETNTETKWISYDNGYTKTSSRSVKMKQQHLRGDFADTYDEITNKRRSESNKKAWETGRRKETVLTAEIKERRIEKIKKTCLEKYGVDNYRKTKTMREMAAKLVYRRYLDSGGIPREQRSTRDSYYSEVWIHTNKSWYEHFHDINPESIQRGNDYHLDHIYSIQQGFIDNVPPEIMGHWTNLRLIDARKNKSKRNKCDKSIEQLYEDYEHYQNS